MKRLTEQLGMIRDTCTTYIVRRGDRALAIDCGQLAPDEAAAQCGVAAFERLLLTHFHRDQCGAAAQWTAAGVAVGLPFAERRFFAETDLLKASYDTYDNYTAYYPGRGALEDIAGEALADYDRLQWEGVQFEIVPLPGHTFGSVGYVFELEGTRYLACGDLMAAPGKLHEYYSSQWSYMSFQGHVNLLESLAVARGLGVDTVLPGHGRPFAADEAAFEGLSQRLAELYEMFHGRPYRPFRPDFRLLSEHVIEVANSSAKTYIVRDDAGHALLIDCGYMSNASISANPHRFIDQLTPWLKSDLGIEQVEWFLPSHYHDDHLAGLPALQLKYGTKVACSPELCDIIEHPQRYEMPCLVPHASRVDRVVGRDEAFHWRGIDFRIEQFPGQTWYHQLIGFEADGKRYLSIGDNISGLCFREGRDFIHSFIPKNRTPVSSYSDMPRQIKERRPDVLLTGHGGGVDCDPDQVDRWQGWMDRWTELFTEIIDQPDADMGMDPHWVEFYPYKVRAVPGDTVDFEVRIRNHQGEARVCRLAFRSHEGVELSPAEQRLEIPGHSDASCRLTARLPRDKATHAWTVVADVTWDGRHLGEIAEAVVYW